MTRSRWPRSRPSSASGTARTTTSGARLRSAVALRRLKDCKSVGQPVALVLASHRMADLLGTELLGRAHELHPTAKRGLLISWGDRSTAEPMLQAMAVGQFDYYVPKPSAPPDEGFHSIVEGFLAIGPSCAAAGSHRSLHRTPPRRSFDSDRSRAADEKVPAQSRRSFLPVMTRLPTGDGCRWCRSRVRPGRAW